MKIIGVVPGFPLSFQQVLKINIQKYAIYLFEDLWEILGPISLTVLMWDQSY